MTGQAFLAKATAHMPGIGVISVSNFIVGFLAMGVLLAQEFVGMGGEVNDEQPPARPQHTADFIKNLVEAAHMLKDIDAKFKKIVADAVETENATRSTANGKITADIALIGDRPSGTTPPDSPVLRQIAATMGVFERLFIDLDCAIKKGRSNCDP